MSLQIRSLPTDPELFPTADCLRDWLQAGLRVRQNGQYFLQRSDAIQAIAPGSVVVFRFAHDLVGDAVVTDDIQRGSFEADGRRYEAAVFVDPNSIRIYQTLVPAVRFGEWIGKDLAIANSYARAEGESGWFAYPRLLAAVIESGGFRPIACG